jgi:pilus assembly protein FimV
MGELEKQNMSSRLNRIWLLPLLLLGSQAWALGLGDIRLSSALNQPMYAEIQLLSATPEELNNLTIQLASAETFERYHLDRPLFLTRLQFEVVESGRIDGNMIRVTSRDPVSEPFITFLVEASWSRGRLLREYTLLLDPPTFAPLPVSQATQTVTAPSRVTPSDAGQIHRADPAPALAPHSSQPASRSLAQMQSFAPASQNSGQNSEQNSGQPNFDVTPGGGVVIRRGDTLWRITSRVWPDSKFTINQTMLAIYEANPQAFDGNINVMHAGASLRMPSADDVYQISRGQALSEVQRQHAAWGGDLGITPDVSPSIPEPDAQPSLTLVPPDDDIGLTDDQLGTSREDLLDDVVSDPEIDPAAARINEIQAILEDQDSLLEISDNALAALRAELANLRGEALPVDDTAGDVLTDDGADKTPVDNTTDEVADTPSAVVMSRPQEKGIVDTLLGYFSNVFVLIGGLLVIVLGTLVWFMRRAGNRDDEEAIRVWNALDADEFDPSPETGTERLQAFARGDTAKSQALQIPDDLDATGIEVALDDDALVATGTIEELSDLDATVQDLAVDLENADTAIQPAMDIEDALATAGEMPSRGTGMLPVLGDEEAATFASLDDNDLEGIDANLLAATGKTQILSEDMAVDTVTNAMPSDDDEESSVMPGDVETVVAPHDNGDDGGEFDFAKIDALPKDVFSLDMSTDEAGRMPELAGSTDLDLDLDDLTAALKMSEAGDTINQMRDEATVEQPRLNPKAAGSVTQSLAPEDLSGDLHESRTMREVGTKLDLARAYVDMGDAGGARSILDEVLDEGDEGQKQQAQQLLDSLPS